MARKYGPKAGKKVEKVMREMKRGKLHSGRSGKKVTNPRQAIAIGLSEAREEGDKVPPAPKRSRSSRSRKSSRSSSRRSTSSRKRSSPSRKSSSRKRSNSSRKRSGSSRKRSRSKR